MNIRAGNIRADSFAIIQATGQLVHVRRPLSFTGDPPLWATSGGEFQARELIHVNRDATERMLLDLLDAGVKISRTTDRWHIKE